MSKAKIGKLALAAIPARTVSSMLTAEAVTLAGTRVVSLTEDELTKQVTLHMRDGRGGWIVTANVDILRRAARDPRARSYVNSADAVVADGMPLVWAARWRGTHLPERVTGASLFWRLSEAAAQEGRSVFILGGPPGAAVAAANELTARFPGLTISGTACPAVGFESTAYGFEELCEQVVRARPGLVLVGLGFPKQELLINRLRAAWPSAWYLGCGAAISFAAGTVDRAPTWMQQGGLEWLHRLAKEPKRMSKRYLLQDIPFALSLLARSARRRILNTLGSTAHSLN